VGEELRRSSGLVNGSLVTDYIPRYCSGVQVDHSLTRDCPDMFGELLIVFDCSVLSFWSGNKHPSYNIITLCLNCTCIYVLHDFIPHPEVI
jgi:hypothetical protein